MAWLLNLAYCSALLLAWPWLLYRRLVLKKRLGDWRQKFLGDLPQRDPSRPCLWIHAVSVGEVVQLRPVLEQLALRIPGYDLWITTTTTTGYEVACKQYPQHTICYFPFDFSWSVANALTRVAPSAVVLVELELWPNFIAEAARRQIPVVLINGRVSDRSYRSYRRIRPLLQRVLPKLARIATQNQTYAERLIDMGAKPQQVTVTGSIKFDRIETRRDNPRTEEIRRSFGLDCNETVLIAGSTQAPEEELALSAYEQLRSEFPQLRLMLVPRHKERFEEVAALVERHGLPILKRSQVNSPAVSRGSTSPDQAAVLVLDTLGELSAAWGLADIAFVGGSLMKRGGQNMIEPSGYGAAVLFGPYTHNFKDVVAMLLDADAARVIPSPEAFTQSIRDLLLHQNAAREMGQRAQQLVTCQHGATQRTVELILESLPQGEQAARAA